jgi:hypothetical protein
MFNQYLKSELGLKVSTQKPVRHIKILTVIRCGVGLDSFSNLTPLRGWYVIGGGDRI